MIDIQTIKNEQDYNRTMTELEKLWGARQGTPDGDKLDLLIDLVEEYESIHYPIGTPANTFAQKGLSS